MRNYECLVREDVQVAVTTEQGKIKLNIYQRIVCRELVKKKFS